MTYSPVTEKEKQEWIKFLENASAALENKNFESNRLFEADNPDTDIAKDIVGKFLATLKGSEVSIN